MPQSYGEGGITGILQALTSKWIDTTSSKKWMSELLRTTSVMEDDLMNHLIFRLYTACPPGERYKRRVGLAEVIFQHKNSVQFFTYLRMLA
jgi:hypothetical protein